VCGGVVVFFVWWEWVVVGGRSKELTCTKTDYLGLRALAVAATLLYGFVPVRQTNSVACDKKKKTSSPFVSGGMKEAGLYV